MALENGGDMKDLCNEDGFTLLELAVVIASLIILVGLVFVLKG